MYFRDTKVQKDKLEGFSERLTSHMRESAHTREGEKAREREIEAAYGKN